MARKLTLGGKAPQSGNKVSHSHRKTKRKWMPNLQKKALFSMALGRSVNTTLTIATLRSVDNAGGLDNYLLGISPDSLSGPMRRLRTVISKRVSAPVG